MQKEKRRKCFRKKNVFLFFVFSLTTVEHNFSTKKDHIERMLMVGNILM